MRNVQITASFDMRAPYWGEGLTDPAVLRQASLFDRRAGGGVTTLHTSSP
jgi:hypothetical protein